MAALQIHDHAPAEAVDLRQCALDVWPGLDRRKLARTKGEPARIARLVAHRTSLSEECIAGILKRQTGRSRR
jgi:hypothetical protein